MLIYNLEEWLWKIWSGDHHLRGDILSPIGHAIRILSKIWWKGLMMWHLWRWVLIHHMWLFSLNLWIFSLLSQLLLIHQHSIVINRSLGPYINIRLFCEHLCLTHNRLIRQLWPKVVFDDTISFKLLAINVATSISSFEIKDKRTNTLEVIIFAELEACSMVD